ncbi:MAG: ribonuclease III [Deltaproteobacteria bacterium]|nr:ribonuclease III [Deltaproteobacteria bacterium]
MDDPLAALEASLGHRFSDRRLLVAALTHRSFANNARQAGEKAEDNQRLEFLGDAVLELIATEAVFASAPKAREGQLTQRRAALVHEARMAEAGRALDLGRHLRVGPGAQSEALRLRASVLADTFEAICAALYFDGGLEVVKQLFNRLYAADLAAKRPHVPAKARLQEIAQSRWKVTPVYAAEPAPDGGGFQVVLTVGPHLTARGTGTSKRVAEEQAAHAALAALEEKDP